MTREGFFARQAARRSLEPQPVKPEKLTPEAMPSDVGSGAGVTRGVPMPLVPKGQHLTSAGLKPMPVSVVSVGKKMPAIPAGAKPASSQYKGLL